ncbi:MAG: phosphopantothenoylcysteine decarboxylase [Planctomycetota bacterium]|nr:phosphopantothenoylcysteine decarboxylase [Planctomycetota bacterium]
MSQQADIPEQGARRMLITAGPTQEPLDSVRYLANRSSGRLGIELADSAARRGYATTLLLGPTSLAPADGRVMLRRFRTTSDLDELLRSEFPACDVLVMAAAVADYRPAVSPGMAGEKLRRTESGMTLELVATPDLLAGCAARRRPGQRIVGFALEPRSALLESARRKLARKRVDAIVANPLETMDSATVEAWLVTGDGPPMGTPGCIAKSAFADWLLDAIEGLGGAS